MPQKQRSKIEHIPFDINKQEKLNKMKELYAKLIEVEEARKFFDAETKFNIVIADVNKIIRVSLNKYTTKADIDMLISLLKK